MLPTFVISELGCNVRVTAEISQAPRPIRCRLPPPLYLSPLSLPLSHRILRFLRRIVQVRRSEWSMGTVCASVIVGVFIATPRATKRWKVTLRLPPPPLSLSLSLTLQPMPARLRHVMRAAGL